MTTVIAGRFWVRPGWNVVPHRVGRWTVLLLAALIASALLAAFFLVLFGIPTPYEKSHLNLIALLPLMFVFTEIEELLFRQVIYRWLKQGNLSDRAIVLATAVAWGCGRLGSAFAQTHEMFGLLQGLYLIWIGVLLGELRRTTGSWPVSWINHMVYNATFLFAFSLIR